MMEHYLATKDGHLDHGALLSCLRQAMRTREELRLILPPGEVRIDRHEASEFFVAPSNNDRGMKRVAFPLHGLEAVTVDGENTRLIFEGEILPLDVKGCRRVSLRGFSIDYTRPFHFEGTVVAADSAAHTFDLRPAPWCLWEIRDGRLWWVERLLPETSGDKWYSSFRRLVPDERWQRTLGWNIWMDPVEQAIARGSRTSLFNAFSPRLGRSYQAEALPDGLIRILHADLENLPQPGWVFVDKGPSDNRKYPAIHLHCSQNITLENVTIHHADGMGLIAEFCQDIHLRDVRVVPAEGRNISTTADATHFVSCRGLIELERCSFAQMPDDGINVHGNYFVVESAPNGGPARIAPRHTQHAWVDFAQAGDRIALVDPTTFQTLSEHLIHSIERRNSTLLLLECEPPLPPDAAGLMLENLSWQADLHMHHCEVRGNRARAVLFSTRGVGTVEHNRFIDQSMSAILVEVDASLWHETGPTGTLIIRQNEILGPAREFTDKAAIEITPELSEETIPPLHGRIQIEDNHIATSNGRVLEAAASRELSFLRNDILLHDRDTAPCIRVRNTTTFAHDLDPQVFHET